MIASIIVTNYNYSKFLRRCLRSCLGQTYGENFEVILIDDNSTDNSLKIAEEFKKLNNFKIIKNKKNIGVSRSANKAIKNSKGKYFVRVDADDFISKHTLEQLIFFIEQRKEIFGVACDYTLIDKFEKKLKRISAKEKPISCGILYNKNKFIEQGLYNKKFRHREEEELRIRLGKKYILDYLHIPLYRYRMHKENKTKSGAYLFYFKNKITKLKNDYLLTEIRKKGIFKNKKIIAIIPARAGSKRFKNKNTYKVWGRPMISWAIKAAKESGLVNEIYVSSESNTILKISKKFGAKTILRPRHLSNDSVPKWNVIIHALDQIKKKNKPDIVISLQANSPNVTSYDITSCLYAMKKYNRNEIMSLDKNLMQNSAIRGVKYKYAYQKSLSTFTGGVINGAVDIHYEDDLKKII